MILVNNSLLTQMVFNRSDRCGGGGIRREGMGSSDREFNNNFTIMILRRHDCEDKKGRIKEEESKEK